MRLTKLGHACVRLEGPGGVLVIDPGSLTEPAALAGADAVLISHEHMDHLDVRRLAEAARARPGLAIWTNGSVADKLDGVGARVRRVGHEDSFEAAGRTVDVLGERHAPVHPDWPDVPNVGFLVDGSVFHPGDAFTVPPGPVPTLLVPTNAPWLKASEMIDYVRAINPERAYSIHDGLLNDAGLGVLDGLIARTGGAGEFRRLAPGESVDL